MYVKESQVMMIVLFIALMREKQTIEQLFFSGMGM
jgi:hypothetical protein